MNPRLLLLEDDPVSASFLAQALAPLGHGLDLAARVAEARDRAAAGDHALWLFDRRLPDGDGGDLLRELRAAGLPTPALALSADDHEDVRAQLQAAGFDEVLAKPVAADALRAAVGRWLTPPCWDDAAAGAAVGGQACAVEALRRLFLDELHGQAIAVAAACRDGDDASARRHLHRLKASCGFVGAAALACAVRALSEAPGDARRLAIFEARVADLLA